jgi:hypothetical protein
MDGVVHNDEEDARRARGHVRVPAVQENSNVMVPVQEDERFLVNDDEEGVEQLPARRLKRRHMMHKLVGN